MAYARRRRVRRKRAIGRRKRVGSRRVGQNRRRKYGGRRRPMSVRRVRAIATKPNHNLLLTRTSADMSSGDNAQVPIMSGQTYFLANMTYLEPNLGNQTVNTIDNDMRRKDQSIFFRGWRDRLQIQVSQPVTWRRIVFWSHARIQLALPHRIPDPLHGGDLFYYARNGARWDPAVTHSILAQELWQGTEDYDFVEHTRPVTPLNPSNLSVVSDRKVAINPQVNVDPSLGASGNIRSFKRWYPVNRQITYDQRERGNEIVKSVIDDNGYSVRSPNSPGNLYCMDIFDTGQYLPEESQTQIGRLMQESNVYWRER
ncbi:capsid protein [Chicken genomovirus mg4_1165]|uniref:Capsid protein n=1 Tax=Chicken genomovirus mg4_1165 TaxID=2720941 RepID=A0A6G9W103_9VIRU|nr:capsid protein [Chicken genomovirus mg4_1165]QIR82232.1 capsid protein [Chicken genomovirus mg4_1165]